MGYPGAAWFSLFADRSRHVNGPAPALPVMDPVRPKETVTMAVFITQMIRSQPMRRVAYPSSKSAGPRKMLSLIVVAHPSSDSLSHAMASAAERSLVTRGSEIAYHDLYAEHFDPVQPTGEGGNVGSSNALAEQHCSELARADLILVFHPNWWGQPLWRLAPPSSAPHGFLKSQCSSNMRPNRIGRTHNDGKRAPVARVLL